MKDRTVWGESYPQKMLFLSLGMKNILDDDLLHLFIQKGFEIQNALLVQLLYKRS